MTPEQRSAAARKAAATRRARKTFGRGQDRQRPRGSTIAAVGRDGGLVVIATQRHVQAATLARPTWREVLEWHEHFDGEREIAASAKRAWRVGRYDMTADALAERRRRGW